MKEEFCCVHCERYFTTEVPEDSILEGLPDDCIFPDCDGGLGDIWRVTHDDEIVKHYIGESGEDFYKILPRGKA